MENLDFELEIGSGEGREYPVAVVGSPVGDPYRVSGRGQGWVSNAGSTVTELCLVDSPRGSAGQKTGREAPCHD